MVGSLFVSACSLLLRIAEGVCVWMNFRLCVLPHRSIGILDVTKHTHKAFGAANI